MEKERELNAAPKTENYNGSIQMTGMNLEKWAAYTRAIDLEYDIKVGDRENTYFVESELSEK